MEPTVSLLNCARDLAWEVALHILLGYAHKGVGPLINMYPRNLGGRTLRYYRFCFLNGHRFIQLLSHGRLLIFSLVEIAWLEH